MEKIKHKKSFINTIKLRRLRKKLAEIDVDNFIETKHGQGYMI